VSSPPEPPDDDGLRRLAMATLALQDSLRSRQALETELARLQASHSWRLTAPLRGLRAWLRPAPAAAPLPALESAAEGGDADQLEDPSRLLRRRLGLACAAEALRPRLYIDVTELAREDLGAGIQRVVKRILAEWLLAPPAGWRVEPVRLSSDRGYVHARRFLGRWLGLAGAGDDVPIEPRVGDRFLGLDLVRDHAEVAHAALLALQARGVRGAVVVYDLLPWRHPEWFPPGMQARFADWLQRVVAPADQALCISGAVADELRAMLAASDVGRVPRIGVFPLGADLQVPTPPRECLPARRPGRLRWLMVGTIEPRKGHAQALQAFEILWSRGIEVELVIAGHPGWKVEDLLARLRSHPERGGRLHWLESVEDPQLAAAYRDCDVLLMASQGEGFGLPVVEAARLGLPVLARDLPVFREVAGEGADYFRGDDGVALATAIQHWLARRAQGRTADPGRILQQDWRQAATGLANLILRD